MSPDCSPFSAHQWPETWVKKWDGRRRGVVLFKNCTRCGVQRLRYLFRGSVWVDRGTYVVRSLGEQETETVR